MVTKLSDEDGQIIDMLLNAGSNHDTNKPNGGKNPMAAAQFRQRLESVERWLQLLKEDPAADPPDGLAERTLKRIDESPETPHRTQTPADALGTRPVA